MRSQCVAKEVPFRFHQTVAYIVKEGLMYRIPRRHQLIQTHNAYIDYGVKDYYVPEKPWNLWADSDCPER